MLKTEDVLFSGSKLDDIDLPRIGHQIGIGEDLVHGLLDTETAGKSTDSKGRLRMLYEPHIAYRVAPTRTIRDKLVKAGLAYVKWGTKPYPRESYTRFWKAYSIDPDTAIMACSWGGPQILGQNYALAGFDSPEAMVKAMASDEDQQLQAMINFIENSGLDDELRVLQAKLDRGEKLTGADCVPFVRGYNGPGYAKNDYHNKFARNVNKWAKIPDTPWSPDAPGEVNLYDGKVHKELKAVQTTLDEIGYPEVGMIDGRWGSRTAAAVLAFRLDNKLQTSDPRIDAEFLTMLALKPERPVSEARKNATLDDLRKDNDDAVKQVDQTDRFGKITVGVGGVLGIKKLIDELSGMTDSLKGIVDTLNPVQAFITNNLWLVAIGVGGFIVWKSGVLNKIRLEKHQTGRDVSV